ncbi:MAG: alpha/beta hydrolase [Ignavibacteriales bacterium]|nr:alpha/beta hydrolase [Ignavibacteriales bacterium]
MYDIYFIPGLCFDQRLFENLKLNSGSLHFLNWLEPEENESLFNYVNRFSKLIEVKDRKIILVGHSFGGIVAQEISKIIKPEKVIIISSIKHSNEKPFSLLMFKHLPIYKLFNRKLVLKTFPVWANLFGYNSDKGKAIFINMINNCTENYFKWAFHQVVNWENLTKNETNLFHIHGTNDKTFPIKLISDSIVIKDGSHFMIHSKAEEVGNVLNELISEKVI